MAAAATFGATNTTTATAANKEYDYYRSFNHEKSSCSLLTPPRHHHNSPLRSRLFPHRKLTPMTTSSLAIPGFWPNVGVGVSSEDDLSRTRSLSFACTTAVRHLTGSLTATEGLRFAVVLNTVTFWLWRYKICSPHIKCVDNEEQLYMWQFFYLKGEGKGQVVLKDDIRQQRAYLKEVLHVPEIRKNAGIWVIAEQDGFRLCLNLTNLYLT
ncbi:uncharacterized protein LOC114302056 [Camellia sinensis]|uniref:uncharacterized protein LOC114302056 n=1 Tax=Camellia sinensis TaxID=4442 RepID=UPI0010369814|nr:uncharacterized protein LOC114302056 [Camellia sinensis]